jgi:hypothetical protein
MKTIALTTLLASVLLAACGGGNDPLPPQADVPASATATPLAYAEFVGSRPADDVASPLQLQDVMPPVSDTDEPLPLR